MGAKNTQVRVGKAHYKAKRRQSISVRLTDCQQNSRRVVTGGSIPATSHGTPCIHYCSKHHTRNWNRSQKVEGEEEKQKGAWDRILMRRKRLIKQGQLEVKAEVSYWKWTLILPDFRTKQQLCSCVLCVCLLCPVLYRGSVSRASHIFHKSRKAGMCWEQLDWARSPQKFLPNLQGSHTKCLTPVFGC